MSKQQISNKSIYGEYSKSEDRVTAALLQIMHYGGHGLVTYLFEDCDLPSNEINVQSQVYEENSRPDGMISCDCNYEIYIESKIVRNAIKSVQLENHKKLIVNESQWLIYITPDNICPKELNGLYHILWMNWEQVVKKLRLYDGKDTLLEFLINQFILLYEHVVLHVYGDIGINDNAAIDNVPTDQRVIIVGGRWAEEVALKYGFYACQPNRFFLPAKYMAFCYNNRIKYLFEIIRQPIESVSLNNIPEIPSIYFINNEPNYKGDPRKVYLLNLIQEFKPEIENDNTDKNGNRCAFTQKQKYTSFQKIKSAKKTSEL